jgi:hypothetical protein
MNFRRWITALAVIALFAGLGSAQIVNSNAGQGPFACSAAVSVPPVLRSEGFTELVGDIVLTCTGGQVYTGSTNLYASTANITVSFGTNVTSRLLTTSFSTTSNPLTAGNTNEALLLIDEPGSVDPYAIPGWGPNAPQVLCGASNLPDSSVGAGPGGCPEWAEVLPATTIAGNVDVMASSNTTTPTSPANVGANVFSGVWGGSSLSNQVTFYGIPIMPPSSTGSERVYRITNVRINANGLSAGPLAGTTPVYAYITISGPTSVPVNNPNLIAGSIQTSLSTSLRNTSNGGGLSNPNNQSQCSSTSGTPGSVLGFLRFSDNFGTAFKTRSVLGAGIPTTQENTPGLITNSESGLIPYSSGGYLIQNLNYGSQVGLADYGTRLKAVFNNLPANVSIWVSTNNVINGTTLPAPSTGTPYASLVINDTTVDSGGAAPTVPISGLAGTVPYTQIIPVNGTASAVWEVLSTNPATLENLDFEVWFGYSASPATNSPAPGTATVNLSYAPNNNSGVFSASQGATASSSYTVPRFADTSTAAGIFTIVQCTTSLLFPFVTNQTGFDTGIAVINTSADPFGTKNQSGTCNFTFYGTPTTAAFPTPAIPAGQLYAFQASVVTPGFEGYAIAVCQFQLAHGYAFISDLGAQKLAHGYLALILPGTGSRPASTPSNVEALEN